MHIQVAKDHGFFDMTSKGFDLLDAGGNSISLPVDGGEVLAENFVGANFANYDYFVVLSHFKGHQMAGYGGAIKNISIGIASSEGKAWIHSGGRSKAVCGAAIRTPSVVRLRRSDDSVAPAMAAFRHERW